MDAKRRARQERKRQLLRELAELHGEERSEAGDFAQTPHYSVIERAASELGKELSREAQERVVRETVAPGQRQVSCLGRPRPEASVLPDVRGAVRRDDEVPNGQEHRWSRRTGGSGR